MCAAERQRSFNLRQTRGKDQLPAARSRFFFGQDTRQQNVDLRALARSRLNPD